MSKWSPLFQFGEAVQEALNLAPKIVGKAKLPELTPQGVFIAAEATGRLDTLGPLLNEVSDRYQDLADLVNDFQSTPMDTLTDGVLLVKASHAVGSSLRRYQRILRALQSAAEKLPRWDKATEARNKYVYDQCVKGTAYKLIIVVVKRHKTWEQLNTIQSVKRAARAYAERYGLPLPAPRQSGRPAKT